jgi:hypothetical protein
MMDQLTDSDRLSGRPPPLSPKPLDLWALALVSASSRFALARLMLSLAYQKAKTKESGRSLVERRLARASGLGVANGPLYSSLMARYDRQLESLIA